MRKTAAVAAIVAAVAMQPALFTMPRSQPAFPHDSQLLEKLYSARLSEIGTALEDKLSLSAVIQGFNHYRCKIKGADADAATVMRYMGYWKNPQEQLSMAFTKLHPLWLGTIETISNRGGCQSQWAQTTLRNLFKLLDERTSPGFREKPAPPRPRDPRTGQTIYRSVPSSTRVMLFDKVFEIIQADMQLRGTLDKSVSPQESRAQVAAIPGDSQVLICYYFVNDSFHTSVLYWHTRKPEALTPALEATLPKGHPVFEIGSPRAVCPSQMEN